MVGLFVLVVLGAHGLVPPDKVVHLWVMKTAQYSSILFVVGR